MPKDDEKKSLVDRVDEAHRKAKEYLAKPRKPNPLDEIVGDAKSVSDIKAALLDNISKNSKKDDQ